MRTPRCKEKKQRKADLERVNQTFGWSFMQRAELASRTDVLVTNLSKAEMAEVMGSIDNLDSVLLSSLV